MSDFGDEGFDETLSQYTAEPSLFRFYGQSVTAGGDPLIGTEDMRMGMMGERGIRQFERVDQQLEKKNKEAEANIKKLSEASIMALNLTRGMMMLSMAMSMENPAMAVAMAAFGIGSLGVSGYYGYTLSGGG